ncbi:MAG: TIR domain-containing protein [Candidatus Lokiarchaeota archaeon]|nr:TIR domain-containing protein [Candidatus Lokiarchaeota archaeon]
MINRQQKTRINIFISYATVDRDKYHIPKIKYYLELLPEVNKAFIWETDVKEDIFLYMERKINESQIMLVFCSPNYLKSESCMNEWSVAARLKKQLIPIYVSEKDCPSLLLNKRGVIYDFFKNATDNFAKISEEVKRRIKLIQELQSRDND